MRPLLKGCLVGLLLGLIDVTAAAAQGYMIPIVNPHAEDGAASPDGVVYVEIPGWEIAGFMTVVAYGTPGAFPSASDLTDPGTTGKLFAGGPAVGLTTAGQTAVIPLAAWEGIDSGEWGVCAGALLGGWGAEADSARLVILILDSELAELARFVVGPVTASDRNNVTTLKRLDSCRSIPVGARAIRAQIELYGVEGPWNNAFADDIAVMIVSPDPVRSTTWGMVKAGAWPSDGPGSPR